jgi:catalase (peroxidase I)
MMKSRPLMLYLSGGPQINFRAGRIDAQPQESLQSHTTAFARMGFTPTEMIQLVACGHTIGGVQKVAFPDIVPATVPTSANPDGNMAFDQTPTSFDNHM